MKDGVIPLANTIFLWQSLLAVLSRSWRWRPSSGFIVPTGRIRTAAELRIDLGPASNEENGTGTATEKPRPGEWLEHRALGERVVVLGGGLPGTS